MRRIVTFGLCVLVAPVLAFGQTKDDFAYWDLSGNGDLTCSEALGRDEGLRLPAYRDDRDGTGLIYEWLERSRSSDSDNDGIGCDSESNPNGYIPNFEAVEPQGCSADADTWRGLRVCEEQSRDGYDRDAFGSAYSSLEGRDHRGPSAVDEGSLARSIRRTRASRSTSRRPGPRLRTSNTSWPSPRRTTPESPMIGDGTSPADLGQPHDRGPDREPVAEERPGRGRVGAGPTRRVVRGAGGPGEAGVRSERRPGRAGCARGAVRGRRGGAELRGRGRHVAYGGHQQHRQRPRQRPLLDLDRFLGTGERLRARGSGRRERRRLRPARERRELRSEPSRPPRRAA